MPWKIEDNSSGLRVISGAAPALLYDASGNPLALPNRTAINPITQPGVVNMGVDYKSARLLRASPDGSLRTSDDSLYLYDSIEGAAVDTNKWIQTTTTMTITQAVATGTLFNAGSSVAATVGAMHTSHRRFALIARSTLAFRARIRATAHFNNNLHEFGLVNPPAAATTAQVPDGFFWRKQGDGNWVPVISVNGTDAAVGSAISDATFVAAVPTNSYAHFSVFVEDSRATFRIVTTAGAVVAGSEQVLEFTASVGTTAVTHLQAFVRTYNSAGTGTAVQLLVSQLAVYGCDSVSQRPWDTSMAGMGHGLLTSPTAFTQLANYANSAAPASATLSNTAAGYTTLGGQWQFAAVAGAETDFALFGFTNPSPYTMFVKRVKIHAFNMGAAVATTAHGLQWGLGFNASAVSLATGAPYPAMRKTIGQMFIPVGGVIGQSFNTPVEWEGLEPVFPGRFFHIILKVHTGTATASQIIRGTADVEGFFDG